MYFWEVAPGKRPLGKTLPKYPGGGAEKTSAGIGLTFYQVLEIKVKCMDENTCSISLEVFTRKNICSIFLASQDS